MNDPNDWSDHKALLELGFRDFQVRAIVEQGQCLGTVAVVGGDARAVELIAAQDFSYALAAGEKTQICLPEPGFVYAPLDCNQFAGYAHILVDGCPVGKIEMRYGQRVEQETAPKKSLWEKIFGKDR